MSEVNPNYVHPQTHLKTCKRFSFSGRYDKIRQEFVFIGFCEGIPTRTKGETHYMIFCPQRNCPNIGVRAKTIEEAERLWNEQNTISGEDE